MPGREQWQIEFLKSCAALSGLPGDAAPEAALLGRSNVGKSSLLNTLAGQRQLARVSRTPGRTRLLNLYSVNDGRLRLVDCPGYGYAAASRSLRRAWGELIGDYLEQRANLRLAVLLVDSRLEPQPLDLEACDWLRGRAMPLQLIATKWDRLSGNQRAAAARRLAEAFGAEPLPFSSVTGEGGAELQRRLLALTSNRSA
ncbi:MAG: ribosome biogenesis GTP-binding protein YihA/YsxC [Terriglobales bacterium]